MGAGLKGFIWSKTVCGIRTVRIVRRERNHTGRRNRQDCRRDLGRAHTKGELSLSELKKAVKGQETHLRLGNWVAGARKPALRSRQKKRSFRIRLKQERAKAGGRLVG